MQAVGAISSHIINGGSVSMRSVIWRSLMRYLKPLKLLATVAAVCLSALAAAQGVARFGTARFGEAVFASATSSVPSVPVPSMPFWATVSLALAVWVLVYLIRTKEV